MSLVRCQQDNCTRVTPQGTYSVNGKVSCRECYEAEQARRWREDFGREHRPKQLDE